MFRLPTLSLTLALALGLASPARADEDPRQTARDHYQRGVELANRGEYKTALQEFDQAYAASPNFAVLYNIGQADVALGRPRKAIDALEKYLHDGGAGVPSERRQQVEQQVAQLESAFADLSVTTSPAGARVSVDGADVGTTPLAAPLRLTAGSHVVTAARHGAAPETRVVVLTEGQRESVSVALPDLPPTPTLPSTAEPPHVAPERPVTSPAAGAPEPQASAQEHAGFPLGYVLIGAGVIAGGAAIAQYAWNAGRNTDWQVAQARIEAGASGPRRERQTENNALAESIKRASVVTVTLSVVSGALVAGGVAWLVADGAGSVGATQGASSPHGLFPVELAVTEHSGNVAWSGAW